MPQATDTERDLHERILDAIDAGDYPPGARLLETELAETFGVSRTPVREALRRLESQGVVTHEARKGAVVASLDYNQLGELYAVREVMEGLAARLAARFASPAEVQLLRDMIAKDRQETDPSKLAQANKRFHRQLHLASHNRVLSRTLDPVRRSLALLSGTTFTAKERPEQSNDEHERIVEAIAARDENGADQAAQAHIASAYALRLRLEAER
ncbi:MAG: GntR family transcriptional regulator [Paracoccaceae bacterium]|jgi:DNA-binding GntR family transcriptional regulator|nr:GntR family transcriptional regulator [Paracoccaceae bacterium]MDG1971876.1 GntR family transcriptional regulator [Paracoccaceae bacterium]